MLVFLVGMFLLGFLIWTNTHKQTTFVDKGYIDLSDKDLDREGALLLKGEWEFYDNVFLMEDEAPKKKHYLKVPGKWNGIKDGEGYGTYRCVVKVDKAYKTYSLKMPIIASAYEVFVDGEPLYANGILGKTKEDYKGFWATEVVDFQAKEEEIEIVVQVANFSHVKGGMVWGSIKFGSHNSIAESRNTSIGITFLTFGFLIAISILHLVTFIYKRKKRAYLFFGLFCLVMAIRIMITGDTLGTSMLVEIPIEVHAKLEYLTITLGAMFFGLYLAKYNHSVFFKGKVFKVTNAYIVFYSVMIIITPLRIYSKFLMAINMLVLFYSVVEVRTSFRRYLENVKGECIAFFSILFFLFSIANDVLYVSSVIDRYYIYLGILVLVLGNTIKMAIQVAKMHEEVEGLAEKLEEKVKIRTRELEDANDKLYRLATKDHLTSLYNKKYLINTIKEEQNKIADGDIRGYSAVYIDLDNFKYFNDICGHAVGDLIIKEFAKLLMKIVGSLGEIYRVGGDEFLILLPDILADDAKDIADRIIERSADNTFVRKSIEVYFDDVDFIDESQKITCSIGITSHREKIDINELIIEADHLMLEAKKKGKNRYVIS